MIESGECKTILNYMHFSWYYSPVAEMRQAGNPLSLSQGNPKIRTTKDNHYYTGIQIDGDS